MMMWGKKLAKKIGGSNDSNTNSAENPKSTVESPSPPKRTDCPVSMFFNYSFKVSVCFKIVFR